MPFITKQRHKPEGTEPGKAPKSRAMARTVRVVFMPLILLLIIILLNTPCGKAQTPVKADTATAQTPVKVEKADKKAPRKPAPRHPARRPAKKLITEQDKKAPVVQPDSTLMALPDSIPEGVPATGPVEIVEKEFDANGDTIIATPVDSVPVVLVPEPEKMDYDQWYEKKVEFNPDPTRAVWMSALFPGLGQIYNRRYWKLPIIVGGYLGLGYAVSWNNSQLKDYNRAYRDIMDTDPSTNSYMNFFPPGTSESDLDRTWLTNLLKSRKNYFRRNRDLCIISMVGVYLLAIVDAYVDAQLSHFDVTPDISMDVAPAIIKDSPGRRPAVGLQWALTF